ncbi:MAG: Mut7-C RNAse domain-containing protein [Armatimonadetes bacterium]|nr:Mut7-C RNAse domain-containing protein [Armatimonadota bacterium]
MKFLADVMLGKLARWLRILGCDVAYDPAWEDEELLELSHREGRVLLTRDTRLACRRRAQNCLLVAGDHWREQLKQVVKVCRIEVGKCGAIHFSRCVECNGILEPTDKATVRYRVPAHISDSHEEFRQCLECRRIYWRGTHCQAIQGILAELFP